MKLLMICFFSIVLMLNFILEQIPDEEDIDYEYPKEFEKKIKKNNQRRKKGDRFLIKYAYIQKR